MIFIHRIYGDNYSKFRYSMTNLDYWGFIDYFEIRQLDDLHNGIRTQK